MTKKVTFGQVRGLLGKLGFEEMPYQDPHVVFEHKPSDTLLFFRPHRLREPVDVMTLSIVRKTLDWKGFLEEEKFDATLRRASANGTPRKRRAAGPKSTKASR